MRYYIDDEITIDLDVSTKNQPVVETELVCEDKFIKDEVVDVPVVLLTNEETPEVSQLQVIDYGSSSIEVSFNVSTDRADEVVRGILCGTTNPPTFENADYRLLYGHGNMDLVFTGLLKDTEYYLRPYALSNLGYKYGDVIAQRTKSNPIPTEYQLVEYLRNTGTQYIDTNYRPVETTVSTIKFSTSVSLPLVFYGYYEGNDSRDYRFFISYFDMFDGRIRITGFNFTNRICEIELGNFYVEDLETHARYSGQSQQFIVGDYSIKIFGESSSSTVGDIYYVKITEDGEMVREMYPVYRKADNKPGMYDIVNNIFYTNQGSGEFTVGPDKEWK